MRGLDCEEIRDDSTASLRLPNPHVAGRKFSFELPATGPPLNAEIVVNFKSSRAFRVLRSY